MFDYNRDNIIYLLSKIGSIIEKYEAIAKETGVKSVTERNICIR